MIINNNLIKIAWSFISLIMIILTTSCKVEGNFKLLSKPVRKEIKHQARANKILKNYKLYEVLGRLNLCHVSEDSCRGLFTIKLQDKRDHMQTRRLPLIVSDSGFMINTYYHKGQLIKEDSTAFLESSNKILMELKKTFKEDEFIKLKKEFLKGSWNECYARVHYSRYR